MGEVKTSSNGNPVPGVIHTGNIGYQQWLQWTYTIPTGATKIRISGGSNVDGDNITFRLDDILLQVPASIPGPGDIAVINAHQVTADTDTTCTKIIWNHTDAGLIIPAATTRTITAIAELGRSDNTVMKNNAKFWVVIPPGSSLVWTGDWNLVGSTNNWWGQVWNTTGCLGAGSSVTINGNVNFTYINGGYTYYPMTAASNAVVVINGNFSCAVSGSGSAVIDTGPLGGSVTINGTAQIATGQIRNQGSQNLTITGLVTLSAQGALVTTGTGNIVLNAGACYLRNVGTAANHFFVQNQNQTGRLISSGKVVAKGTPSNASSNGMYGNVTFSGTWDIASDEEFSLSLTQGAVNSNFSNFIANVSGKLMIVIGGGAIGNPTVNGVTSIRKKTATAHAAILGPTNIPLIDEVTASYVTPLPDEVQNGKVYGPVGATLTGTAHTISAAFIQAAVGLSAANLAARLDALLAAIGSINVDFTPVTDQLQAIASTQGQHSTKLTSIELDTDRIPAVPATESTASSAKTAAEAARDRLPAAGAPSLSQIRADLERSSGPVANLSGLVVVVDNVARLTEAAFLNLPPVDVNASEIATLVLNGLGSVTVNYIAPYTPSSQQLSLVQRADYKVVNQRALLFEINAPGVAVGHIIRFGATRLKESIQSSATVIELNGKLVARIELTKIDTNKKPGTDWRWELEWVDGAGNVSPIITDSKMTLLPSRAEED